MIREACKVERLKQLGMFDELVGHQGLTCRIENKLKKGDWSLVSILTLRVIMHIEYEEFDSGDV